MLASKEYGLYQEVHLRFNLMTNVDGLHYFLSRVKNSEFAILVQEINIQKIQRNKGPDLVVNVILAALMEKGEKSLIYVRSCVPGSRRAEKLSVFTATVSASLFGLCYHVAHSSIVI